MGPTGGFGRWISRPEDGFILANEGVALYTRWGPGTLTWPASLLGADRPAPSKLAGPMGGPTSPHQLAELVEQVGAIVRAGGRLGVVLDAEQRPAAVAHPLQGAVVQVDVRRLQIGGQGVGGNREAVVLRRDLD